MSEAPSDIADPAPFDLAAWRGVLKDGILDVIEPLPRPHAGSSSQQQPGAS